MKRIILILFIFIMMTKTLVFADGISLVKNSGFEDAEAPYLWDYFMWDKSAGTSEIKVTNGIKYSGSQSACIINSKPNDTRLKQTINVKPSTLYKIAGWVKTENVGTDAKGANLSLEMLLETSRDIKGTSDWQYIEMYGRTGSEQNSMILTLGLGGYGSLNSGTAYFDDITVQEATSIPNDAKIVNLFTQQSTNNTSNHSGGNSKGFWMTISTLFLILLIGIFLCFIFKKNSKNYTSKTDNNPTTDKEIQHGTKIHQHFNLHKRDYIIMGIMTLVYLIIALYNLGGTNTPQTHWKPATWGESFTIKFDREYSLSRIGYFDNAGDGKYTIHYKNSNGKFLPIATMNQDVYNVFRWQFIDLQIKTRELKVTVDLPGAALNEIVLFEKSSQTPITGFKIVNTQTNPKDIGTVENLFDEQHTAAYESTYMNSTYFDEIYHPRTAYENLHGMEPTETTHPPLGKLIMSLGIALFGMNPFGWRIMGTLFGAAMIPGMYLIGKKIFSKSIFAFISAFLMMFDCMHFTQTRIGTIDSYPTLFIILSYFFMYSAFMIKSYKVSFKKSLIPLLLAGIFWGLGSASKWTAVYTGGGFAVLYFTAKILEYIDYRKAVSNKNRKSILPEWTRHFIQNNIIYTSLCCVIFFIVIPAIIYISAYLPIITLPGENHNLDEVWRYQKNMFSYHENLTDRHPAESPAYSWPLNYKPLIEYRDLSLSSDKVSIMYVFGNPAIFWFGIICVVAVIFIGTWKRDKKAFFLVIAFAFQYLPWFLVSRCIFIYHYFTATPFLMLCIVYVIRFLLDEFPKLIGKACLSKQAQYNTQQAATLFVYCYLAVVFALFVLLYPAMSGMTVDSSYLRYVKWLNIL